MELQGFLLLMIAGALGGFWAGLIGVGGGIVFVFILEEALAPLIPPEQLGAFITANSLFAICFATLAGNIAHYRKGEFQSKQVLIVASLSIPVSLGAQHFFVHSNMFSLKVFTVALLVVLMFILVRQVAFKTPEAAPQKEGAVKMALTGVFGGVVAALTGLGGGVAMVPFMNGVLNIPIHRAKAISLGVIMVTAIILTIANVVSTVEESGLLFSVGYISFPHVLPLVISAPLMAPLGVKVARKASPKLIQLLFVGVILFLIVKKSLDLVSLYS